jgi:hypothetical protein
MWEICLAAILTLSGSQGVETRDVERDLETAARTADSLDAGLFAPKIYVEALHWLYRDAPEPDSTAGLDEDVRYARDRREALRRFREAVAEARTAGERVSGHARARHAAVRDLALRVHADREAPDSFSRAEKIAAWAEELSTLPARSRMVWEESIDTLVAAISRVDDATIVKAGKPPGVPYTAYDACPFEGCCYRIWFANRPLVAYTQPDTASSIAFPINKDEGVLAITGILVVTKLGSCWTQEQRRDGEPTIPSAFVTLLEPLGEGAFRAFDRGRVDICDCDWDREMTLPEYHWWVLVQDPAGRIGWILGGAPDDERFYNQNAIDQGPSFGTDWCR